jgi:hypothetical protein
LYISPHKPSAIEAQGREHEVKEWLMKRHNKVMIYL